MPKFCFLMTEHIHDLPTLGFGFGFVKAYRPSKHVRTEPSLPGYYQYFSGRKCVFAQGHNTAEVGIEPPTSRSGVQGSTTRPPRSPCCLCIKGPQWSDCQLATENYVLLYN